MHSIRIPGFTAEASLYKTSERYEMTLKSDHSAEGQAVTPQMRQITVHHGLGILYLEYLCARLGGGMSSNPDGSATCSFD